MPPAGPQPDDFIELTGPQQSDFAPDGPQQSDFDGLELPGAPAGYGPESRARALKAADAWMKQDMPWHLLLDVAADMTREELVNLAAPQKTKLDQFVGETKEIAKILQMVGEPAKATEIVGWLSDTVKKARNPSKADLAKKYGGKAVAGAMTLLDAPHKYITRRATAPLMGFNPDEPIPSLHEWQQRLKSRYEEGAAKNPISWATWQAARIAGIPLGLAAMGPSIMLNVGSDLVAGRGTDYGPIKESIDDIFTNDAPAAVTSLLDPTLGFMAGGSGPRAAGQQALRAATAAGKSLAEARQISATVKRAMAASKDLTRMNQATNLPRHVVTAQNILKRNKIPEAEITKSFGAQGEFLGKGQMRFGDPFGKFQTPEIIPTLSQKMGRRVELQAGTRLAKVIDKANPTLSRVPGGAWIGRQAAEAAHPTVAATAMRARQNRGREDLDNIMDQTAFEGVAPQMIGVAPKVFERPGFMGGSKRTEAATLRSEVNARGADPEVMPFVDNATGAVIGVERATTSGAMHPGEARQIPGANEQMAATKSLTQMKEKQLQAVDLMKEGVPNEASGIFSPRQTEGEFGMLEDATRLAGRDAAPGVSSIGRSDRMMTAQGGEKVMVKDVGYPMGELWRMKEEGKLGKGVKPEFDPFVTIPPYMRQANRRIAEKRMDDWLVQSKLAKPIDPNRNFIKDGPETLAPLKSRPDLGIPPELKRILSDNYDRSFQTISSMIQKNWGHTAGGRAAAKTFRGIRKLQNRFKKLVLMARPAYFPVMIANDVSYMFAAGMNQPLTPVLEMGRVFEWGRKAQAGNKKALARLEAVDFGGMNGVEFLKHIQTHGLNLKGAGANRLQLLGGSERSKKKGLEALAGGKVKPVPQTFRGLMAQKATKSKNPLVSGTDMAEDFAGWWNDVSKAAVAGHMMRKGENPSTAIKNAYDHMIDYGAPGGDADDMTKWAVSFWTWMSRAPSAAVKGAVNRPGAPILTHRMAEFAGGEPAEYEPRSYVSDRGPTYRADKAASRYMDALRIRMGGSAQNQKTSEYQGLSRDAFFEPGVMPGTLMHSLMAPGEELNMSPAVNALTPGLGFAAEALAGKDFLTGNKLKWSPKPFHYRTPQWAKAVMGGYAGAQAGSSLGGGWGAVAGGLLGAGASPLPGMESGPEQSSLSRKFASTIMSPPALWAVNRLVTLQQGPASQSTTFGSGRGYSRNTPNQQAHQLWSTSTGIPMYDVSRLDALRNAQDSNEAKDAASYLKNIRQLRRQMEAGLLSAEEQDAPPLPNP